jgi:hypothetical protein
MHVREQVFHDYGFDFTLIRVVYDMRAVRVTVGYRYAGRLNVSPEVYWYYVIPIMLHIPLVGFHSHRPATCSTLSRCCRRHPGYYC